MDDEWRFAPDQDTEADKEGNINNFIDLTKFKEDSEALPGRNGEHVRVVACMCACVGVGA